VTPFTKSSTIINPTLKHRGSNTIATIPARRGGVLPDDVVVLLHLDKSAKRERGARRRGGQFQPGDVAEVARADVRARPSRLGREHPAAAPMAAVAKGGAKAQGAEAVTAGRSVWLVRRWCHSCRIAAVAA
jgi:hypothetical protein